MEVYLDNGATTKPYSEVRELMVGLMEDTYGNPSSLHRMGMKAEKVVGKYRRELAHTIGAEEKELYFTSGGTESNNTALFMGAKAMKRKGKKVLLSKVEHPSVMESVKRLEELGYKVQYIDVDEHCILDMSQLKEMMDEETILISVMTVNNETGVIMPIEEIGILKENFQRNYGRKLLFHSDGIQSLGKIPVNLNGSFSQVDLMSFSSHKIHGPKGIGLLYLRNGVKIQPYMVGGGQEAHLRSGTENVPAIGGFGLAGRIVRENFNQRIKKITEARDYLLEGIQREIKDIKVNSLIDERNSPAILNVSFLGTRGEVILHSLEEEGIFVSTGSACSSNKNSKGSHVLRAMGLSPKEIEGAIRFSFNQFNTIEEMEYTLDKLKNAVKRFRKLGTFR